jgi:hypothetical protein
MGSNNETGHAVNVDHFFGLKSITFGFGAVYAPGNPLIRQDALEALYTNGKTANDTVAVPLADWKNKISARQVVMRPLSKLATRVVRSLKASGCGDETVVQANEFVHRIRGNRSEALEAPAEGEKARRSVSSSQLSITQRIANFRKLVELLATVPEYQPSSADIQAPALQTLLAGMEAANQAAVTAEVPLAIARRHRDGVLYTPDTGLTDIAQAVKDEVASIFGFGSPEHKQVRRIKFTSPR